MLAQMSRSDFKRVFNGLPADLRSVAFECPDDVITDVKSISDKETRMGMYQRINDLRRERIRALATPQAAPFYQEDSMKVVPMSPFLE